MPYAPPMAGPKLFVPPPDASGGPAGGAVRPGVSVVVPTYREAENLPELVGRLAAALEPGHRWEVVVVDDDSRDGTAEICAALAADHPLRLVTRVGERGLATAAVRGLTEATGAVRVVMDADLSHPPEAVPALVAAVTGPGAADFAIGSRYTPGGAVDAGWGPLRRLNSKAATVLARGLTAAADPLAGFFALRAETFEACPPLDPVGYKIGLELLVKAGVRAVAEVPITFRDRTRGSSKLTVAQQLAYLRHLGRLYGYRAARRAA